MVSDCRTIWPNPVSSRLAVWAYLSSLVLLPWSWFPPFPWLHEHAQWSDLLFALATLGWLIECIRTHRWPRWRSLHTALAAYGVWAGISWWFSSAASGGRGKLLGIAELILLAVFTSEFLQPSENRIWFARAIALTAWLTTAAALLGLGLFYAGIHTRLIGTYGDLVASSSYARVQAGTYQPNMLASFCIFASAITAYALPSTRWRRLTQAALWLLVLLTFARGILGFALAAAIRHADTKWQRKVTLAFAALCICVLAVLTIWNFSFDPSHPSAWQVAATDSSRWQAMTSAWQTLVAHPLLGSGTGTSPGVYRDMPFDAHCTPLNLAATMGLPALAAFVTIFLLLWRQRPQPLNLVLWSGLAGLALDALAQDIEDFRHLWILIGALDADANQKTT